MSTQPERDRGGPDNEISGDVTGEVVQAGYIDAVHGGPRTVQNAAHITNFHGPVYAPGAHFGPRYEAAPDHDDREANTP